MKNQKITIVLILILLFSSCTYFQKKPLEEAKMIKSFFDTVYKENKTPKDLYSMYFYEDPEAVKIRDTIMTIFEKHITQIKSKKEHLLSPNTKFFVERYKESKRNDLIKFIKDENGEENIFVVTANDKIEFYVLLKQGKIYSFEHVIKSQEGLFIAYY